MASAAAMHVGWIGVGKMGLPMARHLLASGHTVLAYDVVADHVAALKEQGAERAASVGEVARRAPIVFSSLPHDAALRAVALGPDGVIANAAPGALFIDTSTVSPAVSADVAEAAAARGVRYLRVTVSGNNHMAARAALTVMASGPRAAYDEVKPLLDCFGPNVFHVGEAEQARVLKLVINLMIAGTGAMLSEALALGRRGGLEWAQMLHIVAASAVGSPIVKAKSVELEKRDFTPTFTCVQMQKDIDLILGAGKELGVAMPVTAVVAQLMQSCIGMGDADDDYIATVKLIERLSGLDTGHVA
jgi:3-hydroxyisobutyrate dehydrogenase